MILNMNPTKQPEKPGASAVQPAKGPTSKGPRERLKSHSKRTGERFQYAETAGKRLARLEEAAGGRLKSISRSITFYSFLRHLTEAQMFRLIKALYDTRRMGRYITVALDSFTVRFERGDLPEYAGASLICADGYEVENEEEEEEEPEECEQ